MKQLKIFLICTILLFTLSACQQTDINAYNSVSQKHNQELTIAFNDFQKSIDLYNGQNYDEAIISAQNAKSEFTTSKNLSQQSRDLAKNIKGKNWLADFKEIYLQMEDLKIQQCDLLIKSAQAAKNKDNTAAQESINQMSELNNKYNQMQNTLTDIKNQHPKDFQ